MSIATGRSVLRCSLIKHSQQSAAAAVMKVVIGSVAEAAGSLCSYRVFVMITVFIDRRPVSPAKYLRYIHFPVYTNMRMELVVVFYRLTIDSLRAKVGQQGVA